VIRVSTPNISESFRVRFCEGFGVLKAGMAGERFSLLLTRSWCTPKVENLVRGKKPEPRRNAQ